MNKDRTILMAQMGTGKMPEVLKTTLGSCIGIVLYDPKNEIFGLAHVMLARAHGTAVENPAKYADTAIPNLLQMMQVPMGDASRVKAKIAGGANMFSDIVGSGLMNVGQQNIDTVKEILEKFGISVIGEDVGGHKGRQLTVDTESRRVFVQFVGGSPKEI